MLDGYLQSRRRQPKCEATRWCWRKAKGSVVAMPEDQNGEVIGRFGINVCNKHKDAAMVAGKKWADEYEKLYGVKAKPEAVFDLAEEHGFEKLPTDKYLDGLSRDHRRRQAAKTVADSGNKKLDEAVVSGIKKSQKGGASVSKPKSAKPVRKGRSAANRKRTKK